MIKADKIGDEMHLSFVNDCLIKRKADFLDPIKKVNLDIGLKKIKKILKAVSAMKEDRQAFVIILGQRSEPKRGARYPITLVQLSLAFPDSTHRQNARQHFCNYLINVSKARESTLPKPPNEAHYGYYVRHEKVKDTFEEWFKTVLNFAPRLEV